MLDKSKFLELASDFWDDLAAKKSDSENMYDYEKGLDKLLVEFGRKTLEGTLGSIPGDRRKKKSPKSLRSNTDSQE